MNIDEKIIAQTITMRDQSQIKRLSYADIAEQLLGDRSLSEKLRSAVRSYKRRNSIHTILDPIDKLFGETVIVPELPTLIIGDTHCPYQNKDLLVAAFNLAKKRGIKQLIHAGDLIDAASYNSQAKGETVSPIETDIIHARSILYTAYSYDFKTWLVPGNHDLYYIKKTDISFQEFIHSVVLQEKYTRVFTTTEYDYLYYGNFALVGHLSSGYDMTPGKIAASIADKYNKHALVGHDHLCGAMQGSKGKWGLSIGGMFIPDSFWYKSRSYNTFPQSMVGFCIIENGKIYQYDENLNERIYE